MPTKLKRPTKKQLSEAKAIIERDVAVDRQERDEELSLMVGKCFRYRNRFSGDAWWWKYFRVERVDGYALRGLTFEETRDPNQFEVHPDAYMSHLNPDNGYDEISPEEFHEALGEFVARLRKRVTP